MRILDIPYEPPLFDASCGLLLRDELHHSFDRLEWSLYHKVSRAAMKHLTQSVEHRLPLTHGGWLILCALFHIESVGDGYATWPENPSRPIPWTSRIQAGPETC